MYIPRKRIITIKRYGKYTRVIEAPEPVRPTQNGSENKGGKRDTNPDTPKARCNSSFSAHRALAIALNNNWHWYGHLQLAKEPVTTFDDAYKITKKLRDRLDKQRERTEEKNFVYLIVPDFTEQGSVQKWFLHIWLMNVPNAEKAFLQDLVSEKKITYHWKKYEKQNGYSELYKIYDSGKATNGQWVEQNAFQIFEIMKRTAPVIPKDKRLYYASNDLTIDIVIAEGRPSEINKIISDPRGNGFVRSEWVTGLDLEENIAEAKKYLLSNDFDIEERNLADLFLIPPPEPEQQEDPFFSYDNYSYEGEYIPPADDDYFFCDNTEYSEPVADFDYSVLNEIYENEVYNFD